MTISAPRSPERDIDLFQRVVGTDFDAELGDASVRVVYITGGEGYGYDYTTDWYDLHAVAGIVEFLVANEAVLAVSGSKWQ